MVVVKSTCLGGTPGSLERAVGGVAPRCAHRVRGFEHALPMPSRVGLSLRRGAQRQRRSSEEAPSSPPNHACYLYVLSGGQAALSLIVRSRAFPVWDRTPFATGVPMGGLPPVSHKLSQRCRPSHNARRPRACSSEGEVPPPSRRFRRASGALEHVFASGEARRRYRVGGDSTLTHLVRKPCGT